MLNNFLLSHDMMYKKYIQQQSLTSQKKFLNMISVGPGMSLGMWIDRMTALYFSLAVWLITCAQTATQAKTVRIRKVRMTRNDHTWRQKFICLMLLVSDYCLLFYCPHR